MRRRSCVGGQLVSSSACAAVVAGWLVWGAALALGQVQAKDPVPRHVAALRSGDEKAKIKAIDALGRMGPAAKAATSALAAQLDDKSATVRAHAAYALREIGPDAAGAAKALATAVADDDFHVRRMAIAAIERIKPEPKLVDEALGKALVDENHSVRNAALHALTEYGEAALPALTAALRHPETAYWAALALSELGPQAKTAVDALGETLKDNNPQVRREALLALAAIGADAAAAVPQITPLLDDVDPSVRHAAGFALGSIGPAAAGAIDALRRQRQGDELEGCINCWALARIEPQNKEARAHAIEMLLTTAKDKNPRVQSAAVRGLLDLGAPAEQLVPALGHIVLNGEEPAASDALGALAAMSDAAVAVLADALARRPEVRPKAAMLVTLLGPKAKGTVGALEAALADPQADVRREVLFALAAIGPDAAPTVAAIQKSLDDEDPRNRAAAAYALGRIGPAAAAALPKLQAELTSSEALVRVAAGYALAFVAPRDERVTNLVIPVLVQGLQHPLAAARRGAAEALAQVGKPARELARGSLRQAAQDPDETVRKAALAALESMGAVVDAPPSAMP